MTVRRLRQHPSDFGRASTYVETVDLPELARAVGPAARRGSGYYGLVEVEFKRDARDGRPEAARRQRPHLGLPHARRRRRASTSRACCSATSSASDVPAARARPGVRWIRLETDLPNACRDMWRGRLRLRDYLRTLRGVDTEAVFSLRDPCRGCSRLALTPYLAVRRGL